MKHTVERPDRISTYFRMEWRALSLVALSGVLYNIGLLAGPLLEGRMAQCLLEILEGTGAFGDMLRLAVLYTLVTVAVQSARCIKRLYVRKFSNHVNRSMKQILYGNLVHQSKPELEREGVGSAMTKAISDVDACAEGMRKFTTEIFDTGVALAGYVLLLLWYDWRLGLLSLVFPPVSCMIAEKMKGIVQRTGAAAQECRERLNAATLDRVAGAVTYRVYGCEAQRDRSYEKELDDYGKAAVRANIWVAAMPPLYHMISMVGVLFIFYFGGKHVTGTGWVHWDLAAFTTFLSCYIKLSVKSAKAAKLFNAVHKAEVSWQRVKPLLRPVPKEPEAEPLPPAALEVRDLRLAYPGSAPLLTGLSFTAGPGQIIGVSGPVACGKSTLGRAFLCEGPYEGSIRCGGAELAGLPPEQRRAAVGYLGHDPELMSGSIEENILLGDSLDLDTLLRAVCLRDEVDRMPEGGRTQTGSGGIRLSGGQQARLALARTLGRPRPVLILDDPFAALDRATEDAVYRNLREMTRESIVVLISHRLYLFPELDRVIWMEDGRAAVGTHHELMERCGYYRRMYELQEGALHEKNT